MHDLHCAASPQLHLSSEHFYSQLGRVAGSALEQLCVLAHSLSPVLLDVHREDCAGEDCVEDSWVEYYEGAAGGWARCCGQWDLNCSLQQQAFCSASSAVTSHVTRATYLKARGQLSHL